jgi:hypothetical protein
VTLHGEQFDLGATVTFGASPAAAVIYVDGSVIEATTPPGSGTVTVTVTNPGGGEGTASYTYVLPSRYQPLTPYRALDTRAATCIQCAGGAVGQGQTRTIQVGGYVPPGHTGAIVPADASAVVLNVTAVSGSAGTYLTVFPSGEPVPVASNLNPNAHTNIANLVTVALGTSNGDPGYVSIFNDLGTIDVVADVEGYYLTGGSGSAGEFHSVSPPVRVCDSRGGQGTQCNTGVDDPLTAGASRLVAVTDGVSGVSTGGDAEAAVLNLTAVSGTSLTYLTVYPPVSGTGGLTCGPPPTASNLNVEARTNQPNRVIVPVVQSEGAGYVCVFNDLGTINYILDESGWYGNGADTGGALFVPFTPSRICDTRPGSDTECAGYSLGAGYVDVVPVEGVAPVPASGVVALVANVTAVSGTQSTFLTVFPDTFYSGGDQIPTTSDLNPPAGDNIANLVIVGVPDDGAVDVYNSVGTIDFIIDVVGWYQSSG